MDPEHMLASVPGPILVVDDEPYALRAMSYLLEREGYDVVAATNGEQGLELIREIRPRLVLLDVMMPQLDGFEVCRQVRRDPSLDGIYVMIVSAKGQPAAHRRSFAAGADEYVLKPFSPRVLANRVRRILRPRDAVWT